MEEIVTRTGPFEGAAEELDIALENSLGRQQEEFVRTGWLLRSAEDTGKYRQLGYKSMGEYAKARFNLEKDVASKYININRKYSEGGYSEVLAEKYKGYGVGKLADMLTLSDEVVQSLSPELTRREIQEVKKEIKEEEKITDIEVMMEHTPAERPEFDTLAEDALYQFLKENKEEFKKIYAVMEAGGKYEDITEKLLDIMAPSGIAAKTTRIPGKGKIMISIRGKDENVDFLNVRNNEKESHEWQMIAVFLDAILGEAEDSTNAEETYKELYGETFNTPEEKPELLEKIKEKPEVAPVQPTENKNIVTIGAENKNIATEVAEETGIKPAPESPESEPVPEVEKLTGEVVEETPDLEEIKGKLAIAFTGATEEQVQGQRAIEDYPEYLPEGTKSNMEIWQEIKQQAKSRIDGIEEAFETDNYALISWEARKLVELMGAIR